MPTNALLTHTHIITFENASGGRLKTEPLHLCNVNTDDRIVLCDIVKPLVKDAKRMLLVPS